MLFRSEYGIFGLWRAERKVQHNVISLWKAANYVACIDFMLKLRDGKWAVEFLSAQAKR